MKNNKKDFSNLKKLKSELSNFICPDFPDLKIYSNAYYRNVFLSLFNNESENFSYIYFDFNKLNAINKLYGEETGDKALKNALQVISTALPDKALMTRLGGDEFSILLPNTTEEEAKEVEKHIHSELKKYASFIFGLSIASSAKDSTNGNISELEQLTEKDVTKQKQASKAKTVDFHDLNFLSLETPKNVPEDEIKLWDKLNSNIEDSISNHLTNVRPSDKFVYNSQDLKQEVFHSLNIFSSLLENSLENKDILESFMASDSNETKKDTNTPKVSTDTIKAINDFLANKITFDNLAKNYDLESINTFMNHLLSQLIINDKSQSFNKYYLNLYLLNKLADTNKDYQAIYLSAAGIKPSNTAYGHHYTDAKLIKTSDLVKNALDKYAKFNDEPFTFSEKDCFFIDEGGGNYLCLFPEDQALNPLCLKDIVDTVNSEYDSNSPDTSFLIAGHMQNEIFKPNAKALKRSIKVLKAQCNDDKDPLKKRLLGGITQKTAFEKSIAKCINYYLNNIPDAKTSISKKQLFIKNVFTSLLNNQSLHNESLKSNVEKDDMSFEK